MINQAKNILIGLFVVAAISIVIFILLYLHPSVGDLGQTLYVRFDNIDKVNVGTRVTFAGKPVGEVTAITLLDEARNEQMIGLQPGPIYIYQLTLKIDSHLKVYESDMFSIRTSGLLGERSIEITPMPPTKTHPLKVLDDKDVIYAESSGSIEEAMKQISNVAESAGKTMNYINGLLVEFRQRRILEHVASTVKDTSEITHALNRPKELGEMMDNLHAFSERLLNLEKKAEDAVDSFHLSMKDFNNVTAGITRGEGSLGRLVKNEELFLRLTAVMTKADTIMDDINHYGLLFHNNESWKRLRARRMNLMTKLSSPQEFQNYFNDEIDQISTSLSRVSMVLDESLAQDCCGDLFNDCEFIQVFADLMRRVKGLEENLDMYNQQVIEAQERCLPPWIYMGPGKKVCEKKKPLSCTPKCAAPPMMCLPHKK